MVASGALISALVLALAFVVMSVRGVRAASSRATHAADVIAVANRLERRAIDLETGARGFILFGRAQFLQPWQSARRAIPGETRALRKLLADSSGLETQARRIAAAIRSYESSWSTPLVRRAFRDRAAARRLAATGAGKARMDAIRRRFDRLISDQEDRAGRENGRASAAYENALLAAGVGVLAVLLLVALFALYLARVIVSPVRHVAEAMRTVGGGDLTARVREVGAGETRDLSVGFNSMVGSLAEARERIAARNAELEIVLASTTDGISMVDREGAVVFSNRSMERLRSSVGFSGDGTLVERLADLAQRISHPHVIERFVHDLENDSDAELSADVDLPDGRGFAIWSGPVRDASGELVGRLVVLRDVSSARELDRLKQNFVATISHELRTPLTSMQGFLEILLEDPGSLSVEAHQYLSIIERNTHRLSALVGDILLSAQVEAGHAIELTLGDVNLVALAAEAAEDIAMLAAAKNITVTVDAAELPTIRADHARLTQLLANLTTNAVKFTPERGTITIRARQEQQELVIEVADTGHGVSPSEHDRLFEPFFRSEDETKKHVPGTGLGLPTALAIAHAHAGTIAVHNNPGGGTIFRLQLPLKKRTDKLASDKLVAAGRA